MGTPNRWPSSRVTLRKAGLNTALTITSKTRPKSGQTTGGRRERGRGDDIDGLAQTERRRIATTGVGDSVDPLWREEGVEGDVSSDVGGDARIKRPALLAHEDLDIVLGVTVAGLLLFGAAVGVAMTPRSYGPPDSLRQTLARLASADNLRLLPHI